MFRREFGVGVLATAALAGCSTRSSKFQRYFGPPVTWIVINKSARSMYLLNDDKILEAYNVDLGFAPLGHKSVRGDGKTPEGTYLIDRRNPNSAFHLSLGISYPNAQDVARAKAAGEDPGGDIFIHGQPVRGKAKGSDWTAGCIAVKDKEIERIYAMVKVGTPVTLNA